MVKKCTEDNFSRIDGEFIASAANYLNEQSKSKYDWTTFKIVEFIKNEHLWICYLDGRPVGFLAASLYGNFFDPKCKTLKQNLLFAVPGTKAAYLLLKEFIDFGKVHANHILTAIGKNTNIKPKSLERLGFTKLEELYRMEGKDERS